MYFINIVTFSILFIHYFIFFHYNFHFFGNYQIFTLNISFTIAKRTMLNGQQSFSRFIIRLSIVATALSVMAMIVTLAFVNGFQEKVSEKVFSFWGHIHVQHLEATKSIVAEETPITKNDTILHIIQQQDGVQHISTFATKSAVLEKNKAIEGTLIKGIDTNYDSTQITQYLTKGRWLNFNDSNYSKEIVVSQPIANTLQLQIGDTIRIHFISTKEGETSTYRKLKVVGIYKTGIEEYDKLFVLADIRLLQRLNNWQNNQIGGYEIYIKDYHQMEAFNNRLIDKLPNEWVSRTTKEIYPNIFDWLNIQDVNRNVVIIIMTIVAIINLITCLLVLVLERTRMVGILKAIGMTEWNIRQIFIYHASVITLAGIGSGLICGLALCWLQQSTHFIHLDESSYYLSYAPIKLIGGQVVSVCIFTGIICFLSLIIPSLVVKKLSPVKAIQFR